jgi:hypothetical protein
VSSGGMGARARGAAATWREEGWQRRGVRDRRGRHGGGGWPGLSFIDLGID